MNKEYSEAPYLEGFISGPSATVQLHNRAQALDKPYNRAKIEKVIKLLCQLTGDDEIEYTYNEWEKHRA